MFKQLRLTNYKTWFGRHEVALAPVTLLLGVNSAGKTSLLQVLLLLKQTVESPDRRLSLNLGGQLEDLLDLGGFEDLIANHQANQELAFGLRFGPVSLRTPEGINAVSGDVDYDVEYERGPVVKSLRYRIVEEVYEAIRQARGAYRLAAPDLSPGSSGLNIPSPKRSYEPERSVTFSADAVAALGPSGAVIQDLGLALTRELRQIGYLGPLRERPVRGYMWNRQTPGNLGAKGEFAIQALLANAETRQKRTESGGRGWLIDQVSTWLRRMDVADSLRMERQGRSRHHEVVVQRGKTRANLVDVGFGVSQVLPVVTLAYFVPDRSTVILEQPEIHLHPNAQAALAELLVEVSRTRGIQFLVETHSEHLFRRLQVLIAEERIKQEECRLYFVERGEPGAQIRHLATDEYGRVRNWPPKFFGDAIGDVERQTRRMVERRARPEGNQARA